MNINEFAEKIKTVLAETLKKEVQSISLLKLNGVRLCGITVAEPDSNISCTIYLESFFEKFLDTGDWKQTVSDVLSFYDNHKITDRFDSDFFHDFSNVRRNLVYRLINYKENQELLSSVPYTRFLDLAKVYYVDCQIGETSGSILINHKHIAAWGIAVDELTAAAEENTPILYPVQLKPLSSALGLEDDICLLPGMPAHMFVLSNTENQNGAASVCYKDVLDNFSQKIKDDLVVLPSSVHETILLPLQEKSNLDSLKEMVYDINRTILNPSEFLSDNVYVYNRQDKQLIIA